MLTFYLSALDTSEERDIFSYYYEKYKDLFIKVALEILHSPMLAEDAVHNAFLSIIKDKENFLSLSEANFRNSSVLIIKRKCIDIMRRNKFFDKGVSLDADYAPDIESAEPPVLHTLIEKEQSERLSRYLDSLDLLPRQILEMKYILDMSFDEICRDTGLTHDQVNGILRRARKKIKNMMESED
ncbi:hypothetical protein FACS1894105_04130 [Clostridia bacterium]|nr:hypothetical protein FACS1894105_04130 [Clostridia bacterium]